MKSIFFQSLLAHSCFSIHIIYYEQVVINRKLIKVSLNNFIIMKKAQSKLST